MKSFLLLLLVVVVVVLACTKHINAQCSQALDIQNVCLYGTTSLNGVGGNMRQENCRTVNENPFAYPNSGRNCEAAVRADGQDCIAFYASYMCSSICPKCNLSPCNNFCDDHASICPTATANDCFHGIFCENDEPPTCVRWNVDTSKIPSAPVTTTTTRALTTTTTTTTTPRTGTSGTGTTTTTGSDDLTSSSSDISSAAALLIGATGLLLLNAY